VLAPFVSRLVSQVDTSRSQPSWPALCEHREGRQSRRVDVREGERGGPELVEDGFGHALEAVSEDRAIARDEGRPDPAQSGVLELRADRIAESCEQRVVVLKTERDDAVVRPGRVVSKRAPIVLNILPE